MPKPPKNSPSLSPSASGSASASPSASASASEEFVPLTGAAVRVVPDLSWPDVAPKRHAARRTPVVAWLALKGGFAGTHVSETRRRSSARGDVDLYVETSAPVEVRVEARFVRWRTVYTGTGDGLGALIKLREAVGTDYRLTVTGTADGRVMLIERR